MDVKKERLNRLVGVVMPASSSTAEKIFQKFVHSLSSENKDPVDAVADLMTTNTDH